MTAAALGVLGDLSPRLLVEPPSIGTVGAEAAELAALAGLTLDPWQRLVLDVGLAEASDTRWAAFIVGVIISRQNGKGAVLEARELAGLFLLNEDLIIHTAHEFKTAQEAFRRVLFLVQNTPELDRRVARVRTSHGEEGIELVTGQRLRFLARSGGSGRGFSCDCLVLDEAMVLGDEAVAALLPTLSARPNPQVWVTGSAPLSSSTYLHGLRARAKSGAADRLALLEWSAAESFEELLGDVPESDEEAVRALLSDPALWSRCNPADRVGDDSIRGELGAMSFRHFARERLGVPDRPAGAGGEPPLPLDRWEALTVSLSPPAGARTVAAWDVALSGDRAAVAVAWRGADGVPVVAVSSGDVAQLVASRDAVGAGVWVVDGTSRVLGETRPAEAREVSAREVEEACAELERAVLAGTVRLVDSGAGRAAVAAAARTRLTESGAWRWGRRSSSGDISPLMAVTLALWGLGAGVGAAPAEPFVVFG